MCVYIIMYYTLLTDDPISTVIRKHDYSSIYVYDQKIFRHNQFTGQIFCTYVEYFVVTFQPFL